MCVKGPFISRPLSDLVLEAGHAEVEHVQQAVELRHGQVCEPLLQHHLIGVLQHPQQADEQAAAGLRREGAVLTRGLGGEERGKYTVKDMGGCISFVLNGNP